MKRRMYALAVAGFVVAFVAVAMAQQTIVVDVNLNLLAVRVRDLHGKSIPDITAEDFEIFEDGQRRPISHLSIQRQSAALGLLVDRSISLQAARKTVIDSVARICSTVMPGD